MVDACPRTVKEWWAFDLSLRLVYLCPCVCSRACVHACTCVWRSEDNLGPILPAPSTCFWRQGLSLGWNSPSRLGWLADEPRVYLSPSSAALGSQVCAYHTWLCAPGSGESISGALLPWQTLYQLSSLSDPLSLSFYPNWVFVSLGIHCAVPVINSQPTSFWLIFQIQQKIKSPKRVTSAATVGGG